MAKKTVEKNRKKLAVEMFDTKSRKVAKDTEPAANMAPVVEPEVEDPALEAAKEEINQVVAIASNNAPKKAAKMTEDEKIQTMALAVAKAFVGEMMPAMGALFKRDEGAIAQVKGRIERWVQCRECLQRGPKTPPCNGKHIMMVVYPLRMPHHGKWFQGVSINGVRYLSDNRRDKILIPADCESTILKMIHSFEDNEQQTVLGQRVAEHDSGNVREVGGNSTKQATASDGWR